MRMVLTSAAGEQLSVLARSNESREENMLGGLLGMATCSKTPLCIHAYTYGCLLTFMLVVSNSLYWPIAAILDRRTCLWDCWQSQPACTLNLCMKQHTQGQSLQIQVCRCIQGLLLHHAKRLLVTALGTARLAQERNRSGWQLVGSAGDCHLLKARINSLEGYGPRARWWRAGHAAVCP